MISHRGLILLVGALGLLSAAEAPGSVIRRDLELDPARVEIRTQQGLTTVRLPGSVPGFEEGAPDLPVVPLTVPLPPGHRLRSVQVREVESRTLPGTYRVTAVHQVPEVLDPDRVPVVPSRLQARHPATPLVRSREGRLRGQPVAMLALAPVSWTPETGVIRAATRLEITVETEPGPPRPGAFTVLRESPEGRRTFGRKGSLETSGGPFEPTFRPSLDGSPVDMVIITTAEQEPEYQRLADFKTRHGIATVVRTVEWIEAQYPAGVDAPETIRNFIREAASLWGTAWILIGGDSEDVPIRLGYSRFFNGRYVATDLYYSDLDGNWNANGNARFGEADGIGEPGDDVDMLPDVWVGRLPSNNLTEAQILVDKNLLYQQTPPIGYQDDLLFLAEVISPDDWQPGQGLTFDGSLFSEMVIDSLAGHHRPVRLYENHTAVPGALPELKSTVIDSINAGFNLVHHVGHGFINTMSVGLGFQTLVNADAEAFTNQNELCVLYAVNCTSCSIRFNSIGEKFLTNPNGGAVSVVGSTEVEFPITVLGYQTGFFGHLFHDRIGEVGRALAESKLPYVAQSDEDNPHRWTQFGQVCLGDPSLPFWQGVPVSLNVNYAATFELGQGVFQVLVSQGGSPVDSARVTLMKDGEAYVVGLTNSLGQAVLPFVPQSPGPFSIGVFSPGAVPWSDSAEVVPPTAPYLTVTGLLVDDDALGGTSGNGDGRIDAGETVDLIYTVKNTGCVTETGITATLASAGAWISVGDGSAAFPSLDPDQSAAAGDPIRVTVSRDAPDLLEAVAALTLSGTSGAYPQKALLFVHAPVPEYWRQVLRDTVGTGNGDSLLTANEDFAILPFLRNAGHGAARSVELRLRSTDPAVTITDSIAVLGDVAVGAVQAGSTDGFALRLGDLAPGHDIRAVVVDAYGEGPSFPLDLVAPGAPPTPTAVGTPTSIQLSWNPVPDPDLWGYVIYRADSEAGPFARVNERIAGRTSYFEDAGLPGLSLGTYRIAAIDSSGNESPWSGAITASTTLPVHPGWPVDLATSTPGGVTPADLDGLPGLEILGSSDELYALTADGQDFLDGDIDARTLGPLTDTGKTRFWCTPAVGDVDGDGVAEIAVLGWIDGQAYLFDNTGDPLPGWPKDANPLGQVNPNPVGSVCLADLEGDGDLEYICSVGKAILAWHHDGTEVRDGDGDPGTDGVLAVTGAAFSYGTPSAANIDNDPRREILAGMRDGKLYVFQHDGTLYPGFPFTTNANPNASPGNITSGPAIGDIDLDGRVEIVFAAGDSFLYAIRSDLSSAAGFPRRIPFDEDWDSNPALGDIDGDTYPDVVVGGSNGMVYAIRGQDGTDLPGYPVALTDAAGVPVPTRSSPALADIDHDGSVDILIGDRDGRLHAFDALGQLLPGFFIQTGNGIQNGPAVADVDNDGLVEILVQSSDQRIHCWDAPWAYDPLKAPWPMFKGNPKHTGLLEDPAPGYTVVGITEAPDPGFRVRNFPNPFPGATTIRFRVPEGPGASRVELTVFDLSGRRVRTLVDEEQTPGLHEVPWDGRDSQGRPLASGIYPYRLRVGSEVHLRKMILLAR